MTVFLVVARRSGPNWEPSKPLEAQSGWNDHAAFMDGLVDQGAVILGGPLADELRIVLVIDAPSAAAVNLLLERDPWSGSHLVVESIEAWTIRLDGRDRHA